MAEKNEAERPNIEIHAEVCKELSLRKRALRREVLIRRDALSETEQMNAGALITERILEHEWFREAEIVLGFASYGSEIRTDRILQETIRMGKQLYLPKIMGDEMLFFRVKDMCELQVGYKGIREPQGAGGQYIYVQRAEGTCRVLLLMPGVAFDAERGRMGYGKGFYDRFLTDKPGVIARSIGIAHACQLVEKVPCEETDIRPAQVICVL